MFEDKTNVEVEIISASGKPVRKYSLEGKTFIEGKKGSEFSIKIKNPNAGRVEVVISVDGLSVITGKRANTKSDGYIIPGYDSVVIDGWRISDDKVRKFFFTDKEASYVSKKDGDDTNCGVISVVAYLEKAKVRIFSPDQGYPYGNLRPNHEWSRLFNSPTNIGAVYSCSAVPQTRGMTKGVSDSSFNLGTGMGEKQESKVKRVSFERGDALTFISIFYATRGSLIDMGIDVEKTPAIKLPQGFSDFCEEI